MSVAVVETQPPKLEKKPVKFSNLLLGAGLNLFEVRYTIPIPACSHANCPDPKIGIGQRMMEMQIRTQLTEWIRLQLSVSHWRSPRPPWPPTVVTASPAPSLASGAEVVS
jgi:hypothetical protein